MSGTTVEGYQVITKAIQERSDWDRRDKSDFSKS
jgi:hypothetical protein